MRILSYFSNHRHQRMLIGASAMAMLVGITSCSDYDNGYDDKSLAYKESFIEAFGSIDPNHTWNMATAGAVEVNINTPGMFTVKVWTADPRMSENNAYLLGKYENVSGGGTSTFQCDLPVTLETAFVGAINEDGNRIIVSAPVKDNRVKATIGISGTRSLVYGSGSNDKVEYHGADYIELSHDDIISPLSTLPENKNNTGKVAQNFEYISNGSFTIYPMYTITSNKGSEGDGERLGVYTVNADGSKSETVWIWKAKDWFEGYNSSTGSWESDFAAFSEEGATGNNKKIVWKDNQLASPYTKIKTQGITINIPSGTKFGFVLDAAGGPYYSNSDYNKDEGWPFSGKFSGTDNVKDVYAATFTINNGQKMFLAFEDWVYSSEWHDNDFNDLVFGFKEGNLPLIIDKDQEDVAMTYIVACEDLGGSFDWDFNDVVYGIEHVSGQNTARVKLLAAGGTLPVTILYNNQPVYFTRESNKGITDLHEAFGVPQETPVNVGGYKANPIYSNEFSVDGSFTVAEDASKFQIQVRYDDGSTVASIGVPNPDKGRGKEPQAFLVADPNWEWPSEMQSIDSKYSDFTEWVTKNLGQNWCKTIWLKDNAASDNRGTNLLDYVQSAGNKAMVNLVKWAFEDNTQYTISVLTLKKATLAIYNQSGVKYTELVDGTIYSEKRTSFTLSADLVNKIKADDHGGKTSYMVITFDDANCLAKDNIVEWRNIKGEAGEQKKKEPDLTASEVTMPVGTSTSSILSTSNSQGAKEYVSMNTSIVTVDASGNLTRVAPGKTYVMVKQVACGDYQSAIAYAPVTVEGTERNVKIENGNPSSLTLGASFGDFYRSPDVDRYNTVATSSDPSVATVKINGNWLTITSVSAGKTKISLTQPAAGDYEASNFEFNLEVIREATAESMLYAGGSENASWNTTTEIYTWNATGWNLLRMFDFAEGEINKYQAVRFTISDLKWADDGRYRIVLQDANGEHVASAVDLQGSGTRTFYFNGFGNTDDTWNKKFELREGKSWSDVRGIMIGGSTGTGSLKLTDVKLINK